MREGHSTDHAWISTDGIVNGQRTLDLDGDTLYGFPIAVIKQDSIASSPICGCKARLGVHKSGAQSSLSLKSTVLCSISCYGESIELTLNSHIYVCMYVCMVSIILCACVHLVHRHNNNY